MDQNNDQRERINRARERYMAAMHGVQSGIAMMMNFESPETGPTSPKHLRVGVNSALLDCGAMAGLLIRKGVISEVEYFEAIAEKAEGERASYERLLTERLGKPVKLG